jgi:hypothetical protein
MVSDQNFDQHEANGYQPLQKQTAARIQPLELQEKLNYKILARGFSKFGVGELKIYS